ncbi:MAG: HNH endonuclease [Propionibacteriaceae bacterium]|jgi:hypothetical protein|nr:HNH endonuclease [Propionibacteriaceae bacterium]
MDTRLAALMGSSTPLPVADALAAVSRILDLVERHGRETAAARQRLEWLKAAVALESRVSALKGVLAAEAQQAHAGEGAAGIPASSLLAGTMFMSRKEALAVVRQGEQVHQHPELEQACLQGSVSSKQAQAITSSLEALPEGATEQHKSQVAGKLVELAKVFDPAGLRGAAGQIYECVNPEYAAKARADHLEAQREQAIRERYLKFEPTGRGSTRISGLLPTLEAEQIRKLAAAYAAKLRRAQENNDEQLRQAGLPTPQSPSPAARLADGLAALAAAHSLHAEAPENGGDRPTVIVTIEYQDLKNLAAKARLIEPGENLPASQLRQLCCQAGLIPAVLGGQSEPLDVGRASRLATGAIRKALTLRDQGCAFPGCDQPPAECHAHHLNPWWNGGQTSLDNLVLVCPHHHGIVEPSHDPTADRWAIQIRDGIPQAIPPRHLDPQQKPWIHQRYKPMGLTAVSPNSIQPESGAGRAPEANTANRPRPAGLAAAAAA